MPDNPNTQAASPATPAPTVNTPSLEIPLEYSSLPPVDSSPTVSAEQPAETSPPTSEQPREQAIPRDRFDEVVEQRNQYQTQLTQMQQLIALQNQQATQQAGVQGHQLTGLQAPPQPQPVSFEAPAPMTPEVLKTWQDRIANEGASALVELIRETVTPLGNQLAQQFNSQLTPIRQNFVGQQVTAYTAQKVNPQSPSYDPTFAQVQPYFNQVLQNTLRERPNLDLTPQALGMIEYVAKQQAQMNGLQLQPSQGVPFTERPGASNSATQAPQPTTLTAAQQQVARRFGMSDAEYLAGMGDIQ